MSWVRVDDGFATHPRLAVLLDRPTLWAQAVALWLAANCWSNKHSTDGRVPWTQIRTLVPFSSKAVTEALVGCGLWVESPGFYEFRDFTDYNPSKAQKDAKRSKARLRMENVRAKFARSSQEVRLTPAPPRPKDQDQDQNLPSSAEKPAAPGAGHVGELFGPPAAVEPTAPVGETASEPERLPKPRKKAKPERPEHPRHQPLIDHFCARWWVVFGAKYNPPGSDFKSVPLLLAKADDAEIRRRLEVALVSDKFEQFGSIAAFERRWNNYARLPGTGPPGRQAATPQYQDLTARKASAP